MKLHSKNRGRPCGSLDVPPSSRTTLPVLTVACNAVAVAVGDPTDPEHAASNTEAMSVPTRAMLRTMIFPPELERGVEAERDAVRRASHVGEGEEIGLVADFERVAAAEGQGGARA